MNELILLVAEDLPEEVFILKRALERARFSAPVHFVRDGPEALDYFSGEGSFADWRQNPLPTPLPLVLCVGCFVLRGEGGRGRGAAGGGGTISGGGEAPRIAGIGKCRLPSGG